MLFQSGCLLYSSFSVISEYGDLRATQFLEGATTLSVDEVIPKRRGYRPASLDETQAGPDGHGGLKQRSSSNTQN